jgi:hypothetical protein
VIVGLGICGVIFAATSSAATLMGDFRTGYICLTAPRAMFVAQLVGQMIGALLAPVAFLLFWGTGQVNIPNGPYPCACAVWRAVLCCAVRCGAVAAGGVLARASVSPQLGGTTALRAPRALRRCVVAALSCAAACRPCLRAARLQRRLLTSTAAWRSLGFRALARCQSTAASSC